MQNSIEKAIFFQSNYFKQIYEKSIKILEGRNMEDNGIFLR